MCPAGTRWRLPVLEVDYGVDKDLYPRGRRLRFVPSFCHRVPISLADSELPPTLGWTTSEFGGDYHLIDNGPAGGIAPREDGFTHPRLYFATETSTTRSSVSTNSAAPPRTSRPCPVSAGWSTAMTTKAPRSA